MNILLVSDDHGMPGFEDAYKQAADKYKNIDAVIHAGDTERYNEKYYSDICERPVYLVSGNNDYGDAPDERIVELADKTIFVTHGHKYGIYSGTERLYFAAVEKGADIVVFGHTHRRYYDKDDNVEMINPGSLTLPRGMREGSFAVLIIDEDGNTVVNHEILEA